MIKLKSWLLGYAFFATLSCLASGTSAQEPNVFQMEGPNGTSYPLDVPLPDTSCEPTFRGGDCHDCCFDLWSNYCVERKPGCGTTRPSFGHGCGLLSNVGGCLGGLGQCGGAFGHGCSTHANCTGSSQRNGCDTCETRPEGVAIPSPQASEIPAARYPAATPGPTAPAPLPSVAPLAETAPAERPNPNAPEQPGPAETAPIRRTSPQQPVAEIETGIREDSSHDVPVAPLPSDLENLGIPRNELPESLPTNGLPPVPPEPTTSIERSFIHSVAFTTRVTLPATKVEHDKRHGTSRLLKQLKSVN